MPSKFSSSFDDLLASGKQQLDDLFQGMLEPRKPPRTVRSKPGAGSIAIDKKTRVIEGKAGGIHFRLTTASR